MLRLVGTRRAFSQMKRFSSCLGLQIVERKFGNVVGIGYLDRGDIVRRETYIKRQRSWQKLQVFLNQPTFQLFTYTSIHTIN